MKLNLTQAVNEIKISQEVPYSKHLTVYNNRLVVGIDFKNEKTARDFAHCWSYKIRSYFDGDFKLCLNYLENGELVFLTLYFQKANRADEIENVICSQRQSDDYDLQ